MREHTEISEILLTARKSTKSRRFPVPQQNRPFCFTQQIENASNKRTNQASSRHPRWKLLPRVIALMVLALVASKFEEKVAAAQTDFASMPPVIRDEMRKGMAAFNRKDYAEALRWFREVSDQGNAWGDAMLGVMYLRGNGVPFDPARGIEFTRRAADHGNAAAQTELGTFYEKGLGVQRDYFEALALYRKAAEQGSEDAQKHLAALDEYVHQRVPSALQFRCTLEGAPPIWKADDAKRAEKLYDDCLEKNFKRLGAELQ